MFYQEETGPILPSPAVNTTSAVVEEEDLPLTRASMTYEEVVKDLIADEKQYLRDLHMITKVFKHELVAVFLTNGASPDMKDLEAIFSNIMDIYEVTVTLLGSLEDVVEISEEKHAPAVGSCFEELAERTCWARWVQAAKCPEPAVKAERG
ncbi:hypothetical protein B566_EDAN018449 [Ephemera danica]|nr:hypothetical protein B566_EDAN018449 [Ephemera danica]